jgi:hypothetical protein
VRRQWGNGASAVDAETVKQVRGLVSSRTRPWTTQELIDFGVGGRGGRP